MSDVQQIQYEQELLIREWWAGCEWRTIRTSACKPTLTQQTFRVVERIYHFSLLGKPAEPLKGLLQSATTLDPVTNIHIVGINNVNNGPSMSMELNSLADGGAIWVFIIKPTLPDPL